MLLQIVLSELFPRVPTVTITIIVKITIGSEVRSQLQVSTIPGILEVEGVTVVVKLKGVVVNSKTAIPRGKLAV